MADRPDDDPFTRIERLAAECRAFPATRLSNLIELVTIALGEQRRIREARGAIMPRTTRGTL